MLGTAGNANATAFSRVNTLKWLLYIAQERGWIRVHPFVSFECVPEYKRRSFLSEEELQRIIHVELKYKRQHAMRDMFLFMCFTGLSSYIDIKTLTHDKIQRMDFDGEEWIITRRTKTRVSSNVPLMEIAKELIERYKGLAGGDFVFPMPSNGTCNKHLKQIAKACGISKEIGFHMRRHSIYLF